MEKHMNISIDNSCCKGCNICIGVCPEKVFEKSKQRNTYGTNMPAVAKENTCINCRLCERLCPDGAIDVSEQMEVSDEN